MVSQNQLRSKTLLEAFMTIKEQLIVSLDIPDIQQARSLMHLLSEDVVFYKIGLQMYLKYGSSIVEEWKKAGKKVFLDLKLSDIPHTVSSALLSLQPLQVDMINMHALSGMNCMKTAAETIHLHMPNTRLIAVTVLTSLDENELASIGITNSPQLQVEKLCKLAMQAGLSGVVSSAWEAPQVKAICGKTFITVCPGIRRSSDQTNDQIRIMTPQKAILNGADYLVVGRPILQSNDPKQAAISILKDIEIAHNRGNS
jgi:orotidine-5'-phosphate decarboxylase